MKFLHTSDWHIGKKLNGISRLAEQKEVLDELISIVKNEQVDVVLVAGDIYDTYTPSAEAEKLFYDTVSKISKEGAVILVISGNHDDGIRLSASDSLSSSMNVYFACEKESNSINACSSRVKVVVEKENHFVLSGDEKVFVGALCYPTELRIKECIDESETYEQKVTRWVNACFKENIDNLPQIFMSHLFMMGGEKTESERSIELGGARILSKTFIPNNCIYTALGHLHKKQSIDKDRNIYYSGSILQYSFDEVKIEKGVIIFDVICGKVQNLKEIKFTTGKRLFKVSADNLIDAENKIKCIDGFVELTLKLSAPPDKNGIKNLMQNYPNLFIKFEISYGEKTIVSRKSLDDESLFRLHYMSQYNAEPKQELVDLYLKLMNDIEVNNET